MLVAGAAPLFGPDAVHLIGRHDPNNPGGAGDHGSRTRPGPGTCRHIMDIHYAGVDVVAVGAGGINPYMVEAQTVTARCTGHRVPERDPGKRRVRVPRQGSGVGCLTGKDPRAVPAG